MSLPDMKHPTFEDLELLAEVSQLLKLLDLDQVLERVIKLAAKSVGAEQTSLFLHEGQRVDWGHIFTSRNLSPDAAFKVVNKVLDDGFAGWVARNKRGDVIEDTNEDGRWLIFPDDKLVVRSAMCVPFIYDDEVLAVVTLTHSLPRRFNEYHLRLMTIVANQATVAIYNAQLFNRIRSQQRQLQTILQAMTDILIVLNEHGKLMLVNDAAAELMGLSKVADARGRSLKDFVHMDDVFEPIVEIVNAELVRDDDWSIETRSERRQRDFQVRMATWLDSLEGVAGYVIVMHDVTMLRDLHRFKDEMLRVASHDLRSPLALITGYADMIEIDTPPENTLVHEYVDVIKKSTERMGGLLEDLLRVERIRSSPLELHEKIDLEQLVKVVLVNMRPSAEAKKHALDSEIHLDGVPRIVADPVLIRQSMENLITNAIKYTRAGGHLFVESYYEDGKFHFMISDDGIGIPIEHQAHVFESFYRVNQDVTTEKGSGLGLSLVRNVIERHHGEIWVKSVVGEGSTFGFWLPLGEI